MPKLAPAHTPEELHKFLICDPVEGTLTWRPRSPDMFPPDNNPEAQCAYWNTTYAGKPAGATPHGSGYLGGQLEGRWYRAHRVIYAMCHGKWPANQIDHINGVRDDNRISNLRDVTHVENARNAAIPSDNTSGTVGVCWHIRDGRWRARIGRISLGGFIRKDDAIAARKAAEKKHGYHPNHGREPCQS